MNPRYIVRGKIAEGGLGEVYLATDTQLDRDVALKRVRPPEEEAAAVALEQDLLREARTLSALQHPNIVTIYDVGRDEKGPFVVMEFLKGETLDDVIARGAMTVEDFTEVVVQSLEGMIAAQSLGLVHRDLKPGNLMVIWLASGKFQVKILDFGLAKFSKIASRQTEDQGSAIMGSIFFMAPEQFERLPLDGRTDLYSLGCIYYQILTTRHPFDGETGRDVMVSHLQHHVQNLAEARPDVPKWMAEWVMWLISRDMESRPSDAQTALDYFRAAQAGTAVARAKTQSVPPVRIVGRGTGPGGKTAAVAQQIPGPVSRKTGGAPRKKTGKRAVSHSSSTGGGGGRWILILLVLGILGGGAAWFFKKKSGETSVNPGAALEELAAQENPPVSTASLEIVFDAIRSGGPNAERAAAVLQKMKGLQIPGAVARELEKTSGSRPERLILMQAVATHPSKQGTATLLKIAAESAGPNRTAALEALAKAAAPEDIPGLLLVLPKVQDPVNRVKFFQTLETLQAKMRDPDAPVQQLVRLLKDASKELRPELLQLLSRSGHPAAAAAAAEEITAGGERRQDTAGFIPAWAVPDSGLAESLQQAAQAEEDRETMLPLFLMTARRVSAWNAADLVQRLKAVQPLVTSEKSVDAMSRVLEDIPGPEAQAYIKELSNSEDAALAGIGSSALSAQPMVQEKTAAPAAGENHIDAGKAIIRTEGRDAYYTATSNYITNWKQESTRITWDLEISSAGQVEVDIVQSHTPETKTGEERRFRVRLAATVNESGVKVTDSAETFVPVAAGKFSIPQPGIWRLWLEPVKMIDNQPLMNVREIVVRMP